MSDHAQGPGWWQASDGKWYPPQGGGLPPPVASAGRSGCATAAIVGGIVFGVLLLLAVLSILAITFLGRSTSSKLDEVGEEIESSAAESVPSGRGSGR